MQFVLYDETKFSTVSKCVALAKIQLQYGLARDSCNVGLFVSTKRKQKTGTIRDVQTIVEDASCIFRTVSIFEHDKRMYVLDPEDQKLRHGISCGVIAGLS